MPGEPPLIVIDACVLAGTIRRHVVLSFAEKRLLTPFWSPKILDETRHAIPKVMARSDAGIPDLPAHASKTITLLNTAFPAACRTVDASDFPDVRLPDPDDAHVLALALATGARTVLTENLRDFPKKQLAPLGIQARSTDAFLADITAHAPAQARHAIAALQKRLNAVQFTKARILARMKAVGLKKTVAELET